MQYRCDRIVPDTIVIPTTLGRRVYNQRLKLETYIQSLRMSELKYYRKRSKQMRWRRSHRIEWLPR